MHTSLRNKLVKTFAVAVLFLFGLSPQAKSLPTPLVLTIQPYQYAFAYYYTNTNPGKYFGRVYAISNLVSVKLSWPLSATGFLLQQNPDFSNSSGWTGYPGLVSNGGGNNFLIYTNQTGGPFLTNTMYFRLVYP